MDLHDMHIWFRQYAQQMGMQNVRAILPEQIDVLINTSISDVVNQLVRENVGVRNDRVVTDNVKVGQINALRSLYKVKNILEAATGDNKLIPVTDYEGIGLFRVSKFIIDTVDVAYAIDKVLYIVDLAVEYNKGGETPSYTQLFPIRLIEDSYLADTLNDFVLKPRLRSPVAVVYENKLDVYFGEDYETANALITGASIIPYQLRVSYIAKPAEVKYVSDLGGNNVDCDLPESMHVDILKHAVDLYNTSIQGGLYSAQQQQQMQNRETSRNEARPDNEGYQN